MSNAQPNKDYRQSNEMDIANEDWPMIDRLPKEKFQIKRKANVTPLKEVNTTLFNPEVLAEINQDSSFEAEKTTPVEKVSIEQASAEKVITQPRNDISNIEKTSLIKLIVVGLSQRYVKKTTNLLNPIKFIADNYKVIATAFIHLGVPALITWLLFNKIETIQLAVAQEPVWIFWAYASVVYFASLFAWVSLQTFFSGVTSMIKSTLLDVAKKTNLD